MKNRDYGLIKRSSVWAQAKQTPDEHFPLSSNISLADHLEAVARHISRILIESLTCKFQSVIRSLILECNMEIERAANILLAAAILHDIGKLEKDSMTKIVHPISGREVEDRHQYRSLKIANELLPSDTLDLPIILNIIEHHDTGYRWSRQVVLSGNQPGPTAFRKLDRAIIEEGCGVGLVLLSIFNCADIDGHEHVNDVLWFIRLANELVLNDIGKTFPLPAVC